LVACKNCRPDASDEFLAGDDLLPKQVAAALGLNLILDMEASDTGPGVFCDGPGNVGWASESVLACEVDV
jgi:hypothetical protein